MSKPRPALALPHRGTVDFDALLERARAVPIENELERRGVKLRGRGVNCAGPCPKCGGVDRFGHNRKKGLWVCRGCGVGGDIIALVQHLDHASFRQAIETLTSEPIAINCNTNSKSREVSAYEFAQHSKAGWLWSHRRPIIGTLAEKYLVKARGITCRWPSTIAFLPPWKAGQHPALIAAYAIPDEPQPGILGEPRGVKAVHLVLLKEDGSKADVPKPKITVGSPTGTPIVVAPMNDQMGLAICEGIEDALSVHLATNLGAWAAGGWTFLPKLVGAIRDAGPDCVTIFIDDDDGGREGGRKLAAELADLGRFEILVREAGQ